MPSAPMGHADRMVRVAPVTLPALHGAVLAPDVMVCLVPTAVPGRLVIANLATNTTMLLAINTRRLTRMRFQRSLTVLHGVN
jgi:predicted cobalt transporter CbtA